MIPALIDLAVILLFFAVLNFALSIMVKRNDVADIGWGIGFVLVCIYCIQQFRLTPAALTAYVLVITWGVRLSAHIALRNIKKSEDFRYKAWREEWGKTFYWRSFLQVYLLQMGILIIIALPILFVGIYSKPIPVTPWQWIVLSFWVVGFLWEAIADFQLSRFKKKSSSSIMTSGLWKYSRHPNYFGEIVMWWCLFLFTLGMDYGYFTIVSPITITYLLINVSGVPMLEEKYKENAEYRKYVESTPAIFPVKFSL